MSKKQDKQEVNADQSAKSRRGRAFEEQASAIYENLANYINEQLGRTIVYYLGYQPEFKAARLNGDMEISKSHLKMDHWFAIHDPERKRVLLILTDETTTYRGERVKTKAHEGVSQMRLKKMIERAAIKKVPIFEGCAFTHHNALVFPDQITDVANPEYEEAELKTFCIDVNYKTNDYATTDECHLIDVATKISDLCNMFIEIATNPMDCKWDQNILPNVWKEQHVGFDWMPFITLEKTRAETSKDRLLYWFNNHPNKYTKEVLLAFLAEHGILMRKATLKPIVLQAVKSLINERY